jgi:hypothetical protein
VANPPGPYGGQYPGQDPTRPQQGWSPPPGPAPYQPQQPSWNYTPPQPPPKSNTGLIIALAAGAAVVLILVGVLAFVLTRGDDKPKPSPQAGSPTTSSPSQSATPSPTPTSTTLTLTLPTSVSGYTRSTGSVADRLTTTMRESMIKASPEEAEAFAKAKLGLFTKGDQRLIFIGVQGSDSPSFASELANKSPSDEVDSMFLGANVSDATDYPAGPLGGTLRCGKGTSNGTPVAMCGWADSSVAALVLVPGMQPADLAPITLAFRTASEQ